MQDTLSTLKTTHKTEPPAPNPAGTETPNPSVSWKDNISGLLSAVWFGGRALVREECGAGTEVTGNSKPQSVEELIQDKRLKSAQPGRAGHCMECQKK